MPSTPPRRSAGAFATCGWALARSIPPVATGRPAGPRSARPTAPRRGTSSPITCEVSSACDSSRAHACASSDARDGQGELSMTLRSLAPLALVTLLALGPAAADAAHLKEQPRRHRVVYHLSEAGVDKALFVLRNIHNTISGVGGTGHVEAIELVVHGPALKTFVTAG